MGKETARNKVPFKSAAFFGNVLLWVLLPPSMLYAFGSVFAADAGFTSSLQALVITSAIAIAFHSPLIVLAGAIFSLVLKKKENYKAAFICEAVSFGLVLLSLLAFVFG